MYEHSLNFGKCPSVVTVPLRDSRWKRASSCGLNRNPVSGEGKVKSAGY